MSSKTATGAVAAADGQAACGRCHVPPIFTEPGWNLHTPEEIGIDGFQAQRGPEGRYRTSPLKGLWTHGDSGYYHDGRFGTLLWGVAVQPAIAVLNWTGIATAAVAMTAGVFELSRLPDSECATATANRHMLAMSGALACFLLLGLVDAFHAPLAALGLCCLAAGGHLGSRLAVIGQQGVAQSSR